jgi:uncharacterized membrane protein (UPF0127 family)
MKDMNFPIDIIWIDENMLVADISKNVAPESYPETFSPRSRVLYVFEINAGISDKEDIKIGDRVDFSI